MKKYDKYKNSGIEWIGEIPEHWKTKKIKFLINGPDSLFMDGDWIESKDIVFEGEIRYITTGNIGEGKYKEQGSSYISSITFDKLKCTEVFEGDLIISRLNSPIGRCCIIPNLGKRIVTSVDNVIVRPNSSFLKKYLMYIMSSKRYFEFTDLISRGATMQRISRSLLGDIQLPITEVLSEQKAIANYLDQKCAAIDNLIEQKQKLISLYEENRQSMINQAVTRGLNPNVKMKDSGVEWIGEIPEHWEKRKISRSFKLIGSGTTPRSDDKTYYENGIVNWVNTGDLNDNILVSCNKRITLKALEDYSTLKLYRVGTLLVAMYGATIGKVSILDIEATTNQACCALYDSQYLEIKFVYYWFISNKSNIVNLSIGGGQPNISQDIIKQLSIPCPCKEEQQLIINHLDKKCKVIDNSIELLKSQITLYQEYKQSLIFNAVTGKIKVVD